MQKELQKTENKQVGFFTNPKDSSNNVALLTNGLEDALNAINLKMEPKQRMLAASNVEALQTFITSKGMSFDKFTRRQILSVLWFLTKNELDVNNLEAYFETRKNEFTQEDGSKKTVFSLSAKVQGVGNLKLLRTIGVDVKRVYPTWIIHEKDEFTYPQFKGIEIVPPTWSPKNISQKVVRVVIPVEMNDGRIEYLISERASCRDNLLAHIANNMMNASSEEKSRVLKDIENKTLENILEDDVRFTQYNAYKKMTEEKSAISPAWKNRFSREQMLTTKMINNAIRRFPKELPDSLFGEAYKDSFEDYEQYNNVKKDNEVYDFSDEENPSEQVTKEIEEKSQTEPLDTVLNTVSKAEVRDNGEVIEPKRNKGVEF